MSDGPLSHLRVLDVTRLFPGAACTAVLADLGAEVLRVESPDGRDPVRTIPGSLAAYQRGKRSVTLDLRHAHAPEVLRRLVASVDVVVDSGMPAALGAAGIIYEALAADQPGLVWCSITAFGRGSPYEGRAGHDLAFLGYSGLLGLMAGPTVPGTPDYVVSVPLAALLANVGILAAIAERDRTGRGRFVDTSLMDSAMWSLGEALARVAAAGPAGWGPAASRRAYRAADGRLVTLTAAEPRTWAAFCAGVGRPDLEPLLAAHPGGQDGLTAELEALFATRPAAEWVDLLGDAAAAVGPVLTVEEVLTDAHVVARHAVVEVEGIDGTPVRALRAPVRSFDAEGAEVPLPLGPLPVLGGYTDAALAAAGYDVDGIAALRRDGVI